MENRHCSTFCDRDPPICGDGNADLSGRLSVALSGADADTRDGGYRCSLRFFRDNGETFSVKRLFALGGFRKGKLRYGLLVPVPADRRLYVLHTLVVAAACLCALYCPGGRDGWAAVWPAAFIRAAHNNDGRAVFDMITAGTSKMYFFSETGVLTILCVRALSVTLHIRAGKQARHLQNRHIRIQKVPICGRDTLVKYRRYTREQTQNHHDARRKKTWKRSCFARSFLLFSRP